MSQRSPKSILIAVALWAVIFVGIAALIKFLVLPRVQDLRTDFLTEQTGSDGQYDHVVRLGIDSFSGYCVLRSDLFHDELKQKRIKLSLKDDGADYSKRLKQLQRGQLQMAVFPVNSFIQCGAAANEFPGTIVYILDETVGADAIIARKSQIAKIQDLNHKEAKIVLTPDSPSEFLARVMLANFNLPEIPQKKWIKEADGSQEVLERFRSGKESDKTVYALWEPQVTQALKDSDTHVLLDSSMLQGYIVDVLIVERGFLVEHYDVVKSVVEAYSRTTYQYRDRMVQLVKEDAATSGDQLSEEEAVQIVKGIQWKNTLENYAHFGLQSASHSFDNVEDIILKVTDVLVKTGAVDSNPVADKVVTLYYDRILREMKTEGFSNNMRGTGIRDRGQLNPLTESEWKRLEQVGEFRVDPIRFGRGTSRINIQSQRELRQLAVTLNSWPEYYLVVTGKVRAGSGNETAELELATARAKEAVKVLVESGVDPNRIKYLAELGKSDSTEAQSVSFVVGRAARK